MVGEAQKARDSGDLAVLRLFSDPSERLDLFGSRRGGKRQGFGTAPIEVPLPSKTPLLSHPFLDDCPEVPCRTVVSSAGFYN